jgi:hypothetical protein
MVGAVALEHHGLRHALTTPLPPARFLYSRLRQ